MQMLRPYEIMHNNIIKMVLLGKRRFFAALRMTFYVTLNEVKGLICAISEKLVIMPSWKLGLQRQR
jgi:hypothetical protein